MDTHFFLKLILFFLSLLHCIYIYICHLRKLKPYLFIVHFSSFSSHFLTMFHIYFYVFKNLMATSWISDLHNHPFLLFFFHQQIYYVYTITFFGGLLRALLSCVIVIIFILLVSCLLINSHKRFSKHFSWFDRFLFLICFFIDLVKKVYTRKKGPLIHHFLRALWFIYIFDFFLCRSCFNFQWCMFIFF